MRAGIAALVLAYVMSQFFRAFLAVLSPVLEAEIGAGPEALALASGLWFLTFAAMQIPVGAALDRIGPRWTSAGVFGAGTVAGCAVLALAQGPVGVQAGMALIGIGCSPVLMANYYLFARLYPPRIFGTLAGVVVAVGSLGNIASSLPLALAVEALGWRMAVAALGAVCLAVAVAVAALLRDPPRLQVAAPGSVIDILRIRALWLILPIMAVNYLPVAGLRGLWVGPYYAEVFGADAQGIGRVTLAMGLGLVFGNLIYGPLDRLLGSRKWVVFGGNAAMTACLAGLWLWPAAGGLPTVALLVGVALFGSSYPMVMAHGRAFFPPHLVGRGVTLMNLFGIGFVAVAQVVTARLHAAAPAAPPEAAFTPIFGFFALLMLAGLIPYLFAPDRTD